MFAPLRGDDWVPRSVRRKVNRIEHAKKSLTFRLGRDPSRTEMADKLEMTTDEYDSLVTDARIKKLISLDISTTEDGNTPLIEIIPGKGEAVDSILCREELKSEVAHAVSCLPEKERVAVTLYYMQGVSLKEIGEILDVTESRACQLRSQCVKRLKFRLRNSAI